MKPNGCEQQQKSGCYVCYYVCAHLQLLKWHTSRYHNGGRVKCFIFVVQDIAFGVRIAMGSIPNQDIWSHIGSLLTKAHEHSKRNPFQERSFHFTLIWFFLNSYSANTLERAPSYFAHIFEILWIQMVDVFIVDL